MKKKKKEIIRNSNERRKRKNDAKSCFDFVLTALPNQMCEKTFHKR